MNRLGTAGVEVVLIVSFRVSTILWFLGVLIVVPVLIGVIVRVLRSRRSTGH